MASQRITIAKIIGASAPAVIASFRAWSNARKVDDPAEWRPDQWPIVCRVEIDEFASTLRDSGHQPPVIYFSEHFDLWSMGDVFDRWLSPDDSRRPIQVISDQFQVWCYPLPDDGLLADYLVRAHRLKRIRDRDPQEDRWFVTNLLEATLAWQGFADTEAIVVLREVFGGLLMDSELEQSLTIIPGWIAKLGATHT